MGRQVLAAWCEALAELDRVLASGGIGYWLDSGPLLAASGQPAGQGCPAVCIRLDDLAAVRALAHRLTAPYRLGPMSRLWPLDEALPGLASILPSRTFLRLSGPTPDHRVDLLCVASHSNGQLELLPRSWFSRPRNSAGGRLVLPATTVLPPGRIAIGERSFPAPRDVTGYLEARFGPGRPQGAAPGDPGARAGRPSRIPRQIHFLWGLKSDSGEMPDDYRRYEARWRELHPDWQTGILGRQAAADLASGYPGHPFAEYGRDIQRCDIARLMLLHRHGGVYSDLDVEPRRGLDELLEGYPWADVLLIVETTLSERRARLEGERNPVRDGRPEIRRRIANFFMASRPGHPFWLDVLGLARERASVPVRSDYDVIYTTGPDAVTEALQRNGSSYPEVAVVEQETAERFLRHHHGGHWRERAAARWRKKR